MFASPVQVGTEGKATVFRTLGSVARSRVLITNRGVFVDLPRVM